MRNKRMLSLFILLATGLAIFLTYLNTTPFIGIRVAEDEQGDFLVRSFNENSWGADSQIETGDTIIAIDGVSTGDNRLVINHGRIEQAKTITINQDGVLTTLEVSYNSLLDIQILIYFLIPSIYFIICLILSLILSKNHQTHSSKTLILLMLVLGISYISSSLSMKLDPLGYVIVDLAFLSAPILFLHFIYHYMKERGVVWFSTNFLFALYTIAFLVFILVHQPFITLPIRDVLLLAFMSIFLIILGLLLKGYFTLKKTELKVTYGWIFKSLLISLAPYILLYAMPIIIMRRALINPEIAIAFIFILPIGFLYLLTTGRMYLIRLYIKQLTYYTILALLFAIPISLFYFVFSSETFQFNVFIMFFSFTFFFTLIGLYLRNFFDRLLRYSLFVDKDYYQQSIYRFSEGLKHGSGKSVVLKAFEREIKDVLGVEHLGFYLINKASDEEKNEEDREFLSAYPQLAQRLKDDVLRIGRIDQIDDVFSVALGELDNQFIIFAGKIKAVRHLTNEERDWLSTLAYYSSVSIENMTKIDDLLSQLKNNKSENANWINRLIFSWSEEERKKLANDIHDSFLQDIIIVKRKINAIRSHTMDLQITEPLLELDEDLNDIVFNIRETCNELAPPLLVELGLASTLKELMQKFNLRSNSLLSIEVDDSFEEDKLSIEYKRIAYRTIQELLNNAAKHSEASKVTLTLCVHNNQLKIMYVDDGIGMHLGKTLTNENKMGLIGMKERIQSFQGVIDFNSEPGKGLKVSATLPIS